jgi:adenylate cyclase
LRRRRHRPSRAVALALVWVAAAALAVGAAAAGLTEPAERASLDARFDVRGSERPPRSVAVVGIDDVTLDALDVRFPFSRSLHARLIQRLTAAGVRGVAYDVQFTEPTTPREDNALIRALADAPHVVLSTTEVDRSGPVTRTNVLGGDDVLRTIGARAGNTLVDLDGDGVLRRMARSTDGLTTFPVAAVEAVTGRPVPRDWFDGDGRAYVDFPGPAGTIPTYSFSRVLDGRVPASALRGRIVVVGGTAPALGDVHPTSSTGGGGMPGPEYQAAAIATLLGGELPLRPLAWPLGALLTLLLAAVAPLTALRLGAVRTLVVSTGAAGVAAVGAYLAFRGGWIVPVATPAVALAAGTLGALAVVSAYAALERERTRTLFARFVDESVVDDVLARADEDVRLGGVRVDATVLFCDLRGSTALLELAPEAGIEILNRFLSEMADAVLAHGGTLVGFRGDGLMALFGAPLELPGHAGHALDAAEEMAGPRLEATNAWLAGTGAAGARPEPLRMGVGLDSGEVTAGNVGSHARMEYTAIGDAANVAARVEGLTRELGRPVLLTAATRARLGPVSAARLEAVGEHAVRGRTAPVTLYAPPRGQSLQE